MGIGKQSAPAAPDYSQIAASSLEAAKMQQQTAGQQLDWAKAQYNDLAPTTKAYMQSMIANSDAQTNAASKDRTRYEQVYQPVEDQFVNTATGYNSADRSNQASGAAQAEVAKQFDAQRKGALASLESYGVDPSQTRFGALDLGTRVQQAAATAAAGTASRLQTEATGLSLMGEAINIGKGYPGQVAQAYAGATQAGTAGIATQINANNSGGALMGTGTQWGSLANGSRAGATSALNTGYQNALSSAQFNNQTSQNSFNQIGGLIGGGLSLAML